MKKYFRINNNNTMAIYSINGNKAIYESIDLNYTDFGFKLICRTTFEPCENAEYNLLKTGYKLIKEDINNTLNKYQFVDVNSNNFEYEYYYSRVLMEKLELTHFIQVNFKNGDYIKTKITGTLNDLINHYKNNNVKSINFLDSYILFGTSSITYCYS